MLWMLLACSVDPVALPEAPPPPRAEVFAVTSSGFVAVEIDLLTAPAGTAWELWISPTRAPGQCAAGVRPCVPLVAPVMLANGAQNAYTTNHLSSHQLTLPIGSTFFAVFTVRSPSGRLWASPVSRSVVMDPDDDSDHDGLRLDEELLNGANPRLADTDGGGELDGQEFWNLRFPEWPGDDVLVETECTNGVDDDSDGRLDGCDDDCAYLGLCREGDCADGVDGEHDGLVDCEDGDCATDAACYEVDCYDGADGDHDGVADCDDEDCWNGRCADAVLAWVAYADARRDWEVDTNSTHRSWRANGVQGRVRLDYPGGVTRTCTWSVDPVGHSQAYNMFYPGRPLGPWAPRTGFQVQGGCPAVDERLLPPLGTGLWGGGWYAAPSFVTSWQYRYRFGYGGTVGVAHRRLRRRGSDVEPSDGAATAGAHRLPRRAADRSGRRRRALGGGPGRPRRVRALSGRADVALVAGLWRGCRAGAPRGRGGAAAGVHLAG